MTYSHDPTVFASSASPTTWVIDSGATDHVAGKRSEFQSYFLTTNERVKTADGSYNHKAGKRTVCVLPNLSLPFVLHVPRFSVNVLSVSALTRNLNCFVTPHHSYYVFQDLRTGQKIGGSSESNGIYTLDLKNTESRVLQTEVNDENKLSPWRRRLGHAPVQCLRNISFLNLANKHVNSLKCDACQLAKSETLVVF